MIREKFTRAESLDEVFAVKKEIISEHINPMKKCFSDPNYLDKKNLGIRLNALMTLIGSEFKRAKERFIGVGKSIEKEDLSISNYVLKDCSFNALEKVRDDLISFFSQYGFPIKSGREVVGMYENFERLNVPENHPSRSDSETFFVDDTRILRPHCTASSVAYLHEEKDKKNVFKVAVLGNVYRNDDEDSSHTHQFTQVDFLWADVGLTFLDLQNFLKSVFYFLFGSESEYRFRNSYFPFTKPSLEMDLACMCGGDEKCKMCRGSGWIEVLGAGMINREILDGAGYSSSFECIAGGIGLERIALIKYKIDDIRILYENNFDFLKNRW